ncbi:hypothetical protein CKM354_001297900 [Cercospora kikuchii]|uniref:Uncharacterized protein n=1 Tax=Cercospora kikuchii TaxID=84275 RepID=A0A9P3L2I6_9PEZI|nr:uncharacterized protein CKM354_001297900 [Cercospora kikuchii]GIZ49963.1 hypothetical protein CKM354_001297900 [Cercospora kikuchii]
MNPANTGHSQAMTTRNLLIASRGLCLALRGLYACAYGVQNVINALAFWLFVEVLWRLITATQHSSNLRTVTPSTQLTARSRHIYIYIRGFKMKLGSKEYIVPNIFRVNHWAIEVGDGEFYELDKDSINVKRTDGRDWRDQPVQYRKWQGSTTIDPAVVESIAARVYAEGNFARYHFLLNNCRKYVDAFLAALEEHESSNGRQLGWKEEARRSHEWRTWLRDERNGLVETVKDEMKSVQAKDFSSALEHVAMTALVHMHGAVFRFRERRKKLKLLTSGA